MARTRGMVWGAACAALGLGLSACATVSSTDPPAAAADDPQRGPAPVAAAPAPVPSPRGTVRARSRLDAGRYLVMVAGCNDCHTPGFHLPGGENTPEEMWLTGSPVGFKGPWGVTYGSNLRLFARDFDENTWIHVLRARKARPPMPWASLHAMSDGDLRAIYQYIRSLEPLGEKAPLYVPPGQEPRTPYIVFEPVMPAGAPAPTPQAAAPTTQRAAAAAP